MAIELAQIILPILAVFAPVATAIGSYHCIVLNRMKKSITRLETNMEWILEILRNGKT